MAWFRKKRTFAVHYRVDGLITIERHFIVKAADIAEAAKKCQDREAWRISILDWEILDNERVRTFN